MKQAPPAAAPKKTVARPPQLRRRQRPSQETPGLLQPTHKSHPFSRSYRAILPTSLIYIFSKTRDLLSLKPAADYCTTLLEYHSFQMIFTESGKGRENFHQNVDVLQGHGVCQSVTLIRHSVGFLIERAQLPRQRLPAAQTAPHARVACFPLNREENSALASPLCLIFHLRRRQKLSLAREF